MLQTLEVLAALVISYAVTLLFWALLFRTGPSSRKSPRKRGDPPCLTPPSSSKAE